MEKWKKIKGYENYSVSSEGRVRNDKRNRILGGEHNMDGYHCVWLGRNGGKHLVHRLVAMAFIDNPNGYPIVNHKDETRINNNVDNLEWCTVEYNNNYGTRKDRAKQKMKDTHPSRICCEIDGIVYHSIKKGCEQCELPYKSVVSMLNQGYNEYKGHKIKKLHE